MSHDRADAITAFLDSMKAAGIVPVEPIGDRLGDSIIRFACDGDGKGRKNGWAVLHFDGRPAGRFGNHRLNISQPWTMEGGPQLSPVERRKRAEAIAEAKVRRDLDRDMRHDSVALRCEAMWRRAGPASPDHPYLVRKRIPGEGLRQLGDLLLVPMRDAEGRLWNLQRIWPDGGKFYIKGARVAQLVCAIGYPGERIVIAEGYASGAAVRRATGLAVVIAFSAHCLEWAARAMRRQYPDAEIIIAADDDAHLVDRPGGNIGLAKARAAAAAVHGRLAVPRRAAI